MYKILMVDDEPDLDMLIRQKFRREIQAETYQFFFARHGREALMIMKDNPDISLVLTDLNMPEMNGLELLISLKKEYLNLKVLILSAYSDQENRSQALKEGAFDFITKPLVLSEFEARLKSLTQD